MVYRKGFRFFEERSKNLKVGEYSGNNPDESYLTLEYKYNYDSDGYIFQIIEKDRGYGNEDNSRVRFTYVYGIYYE